jgi:hypothetical protein
MNGFDREELEALDDLFAKHSRFQNYRHYAEAFATYSPSLFVVINFQRFEEAMRNTLSFFRQPSLLRQLSVPSELASGAVGQ